MLKIIGNAVSSIIIKGFVASPVVLKQATKKCVDTVKKEKQVTQHSSAGFWRKITLLGVFPSLIGFAAYTFMTIEEHERPEFIPYDYLRKRDKRFPFGDGKRTLFHNPHVNALKEGYEDDIE